MINLPVTGRSSNMKISQLARLSGVPSKTIRYYEEIGLAPNASRNSNGYREYGQADIDRLAFIRRCRELQIPIEEIKKLVQVRMDEKAPCKEVDILIARQLENVRHTMAELALLEETLNTLAHSCQNDVVSECEILNRLQKGLDR